MLPPFIIVKVNVVCPSVLAYLTDGVSWVMESDCAKRQSAIIALNDAGAVCPDRISIRQLFPMMLVVTIRILTANMRTQFIVLIGYLFVISVMELMVDGLPRRFTNANQRAE